MAPDLEVVWPLHKEADLGPCHLLGARAIANCVIREDAEQDYFNRIARGRLSLS